MRFLGRRGIVSALALAGVPAGVSAQNMADYTNYPIFLSQTVPPNILFLVDMGNVYPRSRLQRHQPEILDFVQSRDGDGLQVFGERDVDSLSGDDLVAADNNGVAINTLANVTSPADTFDSSKSYYGMFDSLRCYTTDTNSFNYASVKAAVSNACGNSLLGWQFSQLADARKKETIYQVLVGGEPIPAQANQDGTANTLDSDPKTGENGSTNTCERTIARAVGAL